MYRPKSISGALLSSLASHSVIARTLLPSHMKSCENDSITERDELRILLYFCPARCATMTDGRIHHPNLLCISYHDVPYCLSSSWKLHVYWFSQCMGSTRLKKIIFNLSSLHPSCITSRTCSDTQWYPLVRRYVVEHILIKPGLRLNGPVDGNQIINLTYCFTAFALLLYKRPVFEYRFICKSALCICVCLFFFPVVLHCKLLSINIQPRLQNSHQHFIKSTVLTFTVFSIFFNNVISASAKNFSTVLCRLFLF